MQRGQRSERIDDAHVTAWTLAAGRGDRPALGEFIAATQADVWRFVAHLAGRNAADDLTQDTYLRAMDALPSFEGRSSARSWLLTIARRTVADRLRHELARPQTLRTPTWLTMNGQSAPDATGTVDLDLLLAGLGSDRRAAFVLTQVLGFSYAEAAAICGCRTGTIRSRVARARAELVASLTEGSAGRAAASNPGTRLAG